MAGNERGRIRRKREAMLRIPANIRPVGFPSVAETLPKAVERIAQALKPEKIILFGSYAYGNPTPDSDVDLLVVMETNKPRKEHVVDVSLLLYPRLFPVDILVKTPEEIEEALKKRDFFIREIVTKGQVLYERPK